MREWRELFSAFDCAAVADGADGQLGDFVIEVDKALDDDAAAFDPPARHGVIPGGLHVGGTFQGGLPLARRRHHRLDQTGIADAAVDGGLQLLLGVGKGEGGSGQPQFFRRQTTDAFAVHGQLGGPRGGNDLGDGVFFQGQQGFGGDGFDFGHHQMGALGQDQGAQRLGVGHGDHMGPMGHLHGRGVGVTVHGDHLDPQTLKGNGDFFPQFARSQQHDLDR